MVKIGMVAKKKNKASRTEDKWAELSCDNVESVKALTNMLKAWRGPPIRSPKKSVIANLPRKIWNEVLAKFLFRIVAKINPFFTTAKGDKTATIAAAEISLFYRCGRLKSIET